MVEVDWLIDYLGGVYLGVSLEYVLPPGLARLVQSDDHLSVCVRVCVCEIENDGGGLGGNHQHASPPAYTELMREGVQLTD